MTNRKKTGTTQTKRTKKTRGRATDFLTTQDKSFKTGMAGKAKANRISKLAKTGKNRRACCLTERLKKKDRQKAFL